MDVRLWESRALAGLFLAFCLFFPGRLFSQGILDELRFEEVATGLDRPVGIEDAGDGSGRLFIVLQDGRIVIYEGGQVLSTPFLDIGDRVRCCGERGLLGLAFHPQYEKNGYFFVNYTDRVRAATNIARFQVSAENPNAADPDSEVHLLEQTQPFSNHNGGAIEFGPDGYLYIGFGDGGGPGDSLNFGQTLTTFLGKILRIDVDNGDPYSSPPSNPYFGLDNTQDEIWAYGLRNPWRIAFDRMTGDLFIADVGQNAREEVSFQPASSPGGENYGWRRMEGTRCFNPSNGCEDPTLVLPILEYSNVGGASVIGGYRYRGSDFPQMQGAYFYADYVQRRLFAAEQDGGEWREIGRRAIPFRISLFGEDARGEILFVSYGESGALYRLKADYPVPELTSLAPAAVAAGGTDFTFTVVGENFTSHSEVRWNGAMRPTHYVDHARLQVDIAAEDIGAVGAGEITVFNPAPGGGVTDPVAFTIEPTPAETPTIFEGGVGNAAGVTSFNGAAAGSIAATFGTFMALHEENALISPLSTTLGGGMLRFESIDAAEKGFDGSVAVPEFFASPRQKNIQIPWELAGLTEAQITARVGSLESAPVTVNIFPFDPGIFTADATGTGQGSILIAGTASLAAPAGAFPNVRPVRGGEFIAIFCTGLGAVSHTPPTGGEAVADPLSETLTLPTVTVGGVEARVVFSGLAPGFVGLYQVNVETPEGVAPGDSIEVVVTIGGIESNVVTIAVS